MITSLNVNSIKKGSIEFPKLNLVIPKVSSDLDNISGVWISTGGEPYWLEYHSFAYNFLVGCSNSVSLTG